MRIAILSCFYPYRGGLSQFSAILLHELGKEHEVKAFTFKRQYPKLLFPGKTQFVTPDDHVTPVDAERVLDSINPFNWRPAAKKILAFKPDLVIIFWWMSAFGPSKGAVAHYLKNHGVKVVSLVHNVIPHERHFYDKPLTMRFLTGCSGHVTMSEEVQRSLESLGTWKSRRLFHPLYSNFGTRMPRAEAEDALGIPHGGRNLLFFGLIRKYKGLDILIKAFGTLPYDFRLIIAGEPYVSFAEYQALIDESPAKDRIHCHLEYVGDEDVKKYFSLADLVVLPYRSATQSGVRGICYSFGVPMVVTDTGNLKADIADTGTGLVAAQADPALIAAEIRRFFDTEGLKEECIRNIGIQSGRLSWNNFCREFLEFSEEL